MKRKFLSILVVLALVLGMSLVTAVPAAADTGSNTYYVTTTGSDSTGLGTQVKPWATIVYAISQATSGTDTIDVAAGTYIEPQIIIANNLTIIGANESTTIIKTNVPTGNSGNSKGWWVVSQGVVFNLSGVTLDGTGYNILQGIRDMGTGTIQNVHFTNIIYPDPNNGGFAIYAFGMCGAINVSNCVFDNIGREGIAYWGPLTTGTYSNNTYTGKGVGDWLDYGVEVNNGAIATITGSTFTDCQGMIGTWDSAGVAVLTSSGPGTQATITDSMFTRNSLGIGVGAGLGDTSVVSAHNNTFSRNDKFGVSTSTSSSTVTVDAINNWWGNASGPGTVGVGTGDNVSTNVSYTPWLTSAPPSPSTVTLTADGQAATSPTVTTSAASAVAFTLATLNGNLASKGTADSVNVSFGYDTTSHSGTPSAYPTWTTAVSVGTGGFSATIQSGLTPGTTYYFAVRAQGNDVADPVYGAERSFTTAKITTRAASSIGAYTATLNGQIDIGSATSVTVSFGYSLDPDTTYGTIATVTTPMTASGNFSVALTGLALEGKYNFKVVGNISGDIVSGVGQTVTLAPIIGISVSSTLINFGSIIAGHSSPSQTVTVTNTGDYNQNFTAALANESPLSFYTSNLKIDSLAVGVWGVTPVISVVPAGHITPGLVLSIPIGTTAGAKTATVIFWATSVAP